MIYVFLSLWRNTYISSKGSSLNRGEEKEKKTRQEKKKEQVEVKEQSRTKLSPNAPRRQAGASHHRSRIPARHSLSRTKAAEPTAHAAPAGL